MKTLESEFLRACSAADGALRTMTEYVERHDAAQGKPEAARYKVQAAYFYGVYIAHCRTANRLSKAMAA